MNQSRDINEDSVSLCECLLAYCAINEYTNKMTVPEVLKNLEVFFPEDVIKVARSRLMKKVQG